MKKLIRFALLSLSAAAVATGCDNDGDPVFYTIFTNAYVIQENGTGGDPTTFTPWFTVVGVNGTMESATLMKGSSALTGTMRSYRTLRYYETTGANKYENIGDLSNLYTARVTNDKGKKAEAASVRFDLSEDDVMGEMTVSEFTYDSQSGELSVAMNTVSRAEYVGFYIVHMYNGMEEGTRFSVDRRVARVAGGASQQQFSMTLKADDDALNYFLIYPMAINESPKGTALCLLGEGKKLARGGQDLEDIN